LKQEALSISFVGLVLCLSRDLRFLHMLLIYLFLLQCYQPTNRAGLRLELVKMRKEERNRFCICSLRENTYYLVEYALFRYKQDFSIVVLFIVHDT